MREEESFADPIIGPWKPKLSSNPWPGGSPLYLVIGTTGEAYDVDTWIVCGHLNEQRALEHAALANEAAKAYELARSDEHAITPRGANPHDPNMKMDYTGTRYSVIPASLADTTR